VKSGDGFNHGTVLANVKALAHETFRIDHTTVQIEDVNATEPIMIPATAISAHGIPRGKLRMIKISVLIPFCAPPATPSLDSTSPKERQAAIEQMAKPGNVEAIPAFAAAFKERTQERKCARKSLRASPGLEGPRYLQFFRQASLRISTRTFASRQSNPFSGFTFLLPIPERSRHCSIGRRMCLQPRSPFLPAGIKV
jgi:hypothetical protein